MSLILTLTACGLLFAAALLAQRRTERALDRLEQLAERLQAQQEGLAAGAAGLAEVLHSAAGTAQTDEQRAAEKQAALFSVGLNNILGYGGPLGGRKERHDG